MLRQIINPVVYEDKNPEKIRRAFKLGCGGVIVEEAIPAPVTAEIQNSSSTSPETFQRIEKDGLTIIADQELAVYHRWQRDEQPLSETCRWLMTEFEWAAAAGFCPSGRMKETGANLLALWAGDGFNLPWHIDKNRAEKTCDIHMHVHGPGMIVASPLFPMSLAFNENRTSPRLQRLNSFSTVNDDSVLTTYLRDMNFRMIALQPGQRLFFNQSCLHTSAPSAAPALKLRGGIF